MFGFTPAMIVGPTKFPLSNPLTVIFEPSNKTLAPSFLADSIKLRTRCFEAFEIKGPISVFGFQPIKFLFSKKNGK